MKRIILMVFAAVGCYLLSGCAMTNWNKSIKAKSDLKYSRDYNPDPEGRLRHDGKYLSDCTECRNVENGARAGKRSLYFFENGSFYIDNEPNPGAETDEEQPWDKRYGIYKVIDKGMIEVNMYDYDRKSRTHYMHTDYYRVNSDSTVQAFMRIECNGVETKPYDTSKYRFVETGRLPRFDIPTERIKWLQEEKQYKSETE